MLEDKNVIDEQNSLAVPNNSFFDILKVRMGEYREYKTEQRNQKVVEDFQNMLMSNDLSEISKSTIRNTPFDINVKFDETKYQM